MRTVTLIGGQFHRKKVEIQDGQRTIEVPIPEECKFSSKLSIEEYHPIKKVKYSEVGYLLGNYELFLEGFFLEETINITVFIRNLILDYIR